MAGLFDLNSTTEEEEETPASSGSSSPSNSSNGSTGLISGSVCLELWHACAGPLISLPKKGSVVAYVPQGHVEQVGSEFPASGFEVPAHLFCRVLDVKLHAESGSDEVYAQVQLVPESEEFEQKLGEGESDADGDEDAEGLEKSTTPHMFCKTLTASDTSTHGGFSVPRRAAEDCFPPLDYSQQRPSQELVAKDLHGLEWKFRHIYRGQPRRHLLTTGWSAFVYKKKLVSGDAVLFLRGEDGELRLGVRRAAQVNSSVTYPIPSVLHLNYNSIMEVVDAISMKTAFNVYYKPRASSSDFIIPYRKFLRSLGHSFRAGMRFKLRFETEDAAEQRYTGMVTGVSESDPVRWPGSKWKCVAVRWDDMDKRKQHDRVSPWEIEPSGSVPNSSGLLASGLKRSRIGFSAEKHEFPVPHGIGASDFGESLRFQKVLQGQEISGFDTPFGSLGGQNQHPSESRRVFHGSVGSRGNDLGNSSMNSEIASKGFGESLRFQKVLQGQELFPNTPYGRAPGTNEAREYGFPGILDGTPSFRNGWSTMMQHNNQSILRAPPLQVSSPSSVLMFPHAMNAGADFNSVYHGHNQEEQRKMQNAHSGGLNSFNHHGASHPPLESRSSLGGGQEMVSSCKSSCRLFGFSLSEGTHASNNMDNSTSVASALEPGASIFPNGESRFHSKPLTMSAAVGISRTKEWAFDWHGERMESCLQG